MALVESSVVVTGLLRDIQKRPEFIGPLIDNHSDPFRQGHTDKASEGSEPYR